jgi:hypothetical protein
MPSAAAAPPKALLPRQPWRVLIRSAGNAGLALLTFLASLDRLRLRKHGCDNIERCSQIHFSRRRFIETGVLVDLVTLLELLRAGPVLVAKSGGQWL